MHVFPEEHLYDSFSNTQTDLNEAPPPADKFTKTPLVPKSFVNRFVKALLELCERAQRTQGHLDTSALSAHRIPKAAPGEVRMHGFLDEHQYF